MCMNDVSRFVFIRSYPGEHAHLRSAGGVIAGIRSVHYTIVDKEQFVICFILSMCIIPALGLGVENGNSP